MIQIKILKGVGTDMNKDTDRILTDTNKLLPGLVTDPSKDIASISNVHKESY